MATVLDRPTPPTPDPLLDTPSPGTFEPQDRNDSEPAPTTTPSPLTYKVAMMIAVFAPFVGVVVGIITMWIAGFMGWLYLGMLLGGTFLTLLGITVSYHRLLSHRAYDCVAPMRFLFTALGAMAIEGSPIRWASVHRRHHQFSDMEGDPHSPHLHQGGLWNAIKGFYYGHMGWLFTEFWSHADMKRYTPDLTQSAASSAGTTTSLWSLVSASRWRSAAWRP